MNPAVRLYRALLWLYPAQHRQAYAEPMLLHAHDLERVARQCGHRQLVLLYFHLLIDGIINAGKEHLEAIMEMSKRFTPVPWLSVILACLPGLLMAVGRANPKNLDLLLAILGYAFLALLVIGLPVTWWRSRRFPVWGLLPAGAMTWLATYFAGTALAKFVSSFVSVYSRWTGIEVWIGLLNLTLVVVIFVLIFRRRRPPLAFWLVLGIFLLYNLLVAINVRSSYYDSYGPFLGPIQFLFYSGLGVFESLMLVAVGCLAARQYGHLALLVLVGGFSIMFGDSDYIWPSMYRDWAGVTPYMVLVTLLVMVVAPLGLLRARIRLGRLLAVFIPMVVFGIARVALPLLVDHQPFDLRSGEIVLSVNMLLSFSLGWILYDRLAVPAPLPFAPEQPGELQDQPSEVISMERSE